MTRRLRRPQLRTQVLAGVLTITLLALAAFDVVAVSALHRYLVSRTDSNLRTALTMTRPQLSLLLSGAMVPGQQPFTAVGDYNISFVPTGRTHPVVLEHGVTLVPAVPASVVRAVAGPPTAKASASASYKARSASFTVETIYRVETVTFPAGTLVASTSLRDVNATVGRFRLVVIIGSAAVGLLISGGVVLVMRRGLRPIETMAAEADRITAGDLTHRVGGTRAGARSEVGRLGTALNGMLTRIEASVAEREASQELMQRFFADASHELRTPLASLRANAELYQQGALRQGPQVDEAMRRIALEAQRMSRLVDDMLRLARLDQHPARQHEPVDLAGLVDGCVQRARIADPTRTWQARTTTSGGATVGDEELLCRAIDNLLANVRTHTPEGTVASVSATVHGSQITVEVSDDGPGVPADQLSRIFDRFYRAGAPSYRPGSGLGLAIVAEIAAAHDGIASAARNEPHGLRVTLTLPVEADNEPGNQPGNDDASTAHRRATAVV
jgi:two-component system, OmpR family, sensor kinase